MDKPKPLKLLPNVHIDPRALLETEGPLTNDELLERVVYVEEFEMRLAAWPPGDLPPLPAHPLAATVIVDERSVDMTPTRIPLTPVDERTARCPK